MNNDPQFIDIQKLRQVSPALTTQFLPSQTANKIWKNCHRFVFKPKNKRDIERIIKYFKERDNDLLAAMPQELLKEAK